MTLTRELLYIAQQFKTVLFEKDTVKFIPKWRDTYLFWSWNIALNCFQTVRSLDRNLVWLKIYQPTCYKLFLSLATICNIHSTGYPWGMMNITCSFPCPLTQYWQRLLTCVSVKLSSSHGRDSSVENSSKHELHRNYPRCRESSMHICCRILITQTTMHKPEIIL